MIRRTAIVFLVICSVVGCRKSLDRSHLPALAEKAEKIEPGMPKAEVDGLLGQPYVYGELFSGPPGKPVSTGKMTGYYDGSDKLVAVEFDFDEKVLRYHAVPPPPLPPGQYQGFGIIKPKKG